MLKNLVFKFRSFKTFRKAFKFHLKGYIDANSYALVMARNDQLEAIVSSLQAEKTDNSVCAKWCWNTLILIIFTIFLVLFFDYKNYLSSSIAESIIDVLQWPLVGLFILMALTYHHDKLYLVLDRLHPRRR